MDNRSQEAHGITYSSPTLKTPLAKPNYDICVSHLAHFLREAYPDSPR